MRFDLRSVPSFLSCAAVLFSFAAPAAVSGEDEKKIPPAATATVDFAKDIYPILKEKCIRCHGPEKQKSELRLDSREAALKGGEIGKPIVIGKSAESDLIRRVSAIDEDDKMPPSGELLSAQQVGLLRAWIDQGFKWSEVVEVKKVQRTDLSVLKGPTTWVTSLRYSPGGQRLVTAGGHTLLFKPGEVRVWDAASGKEVASLAGHQSTVWAAAFDREGKRLATGGYDKLAKIWDVESGKEQATLKGHANWITCIAFTGDGKSVVTGSEDATIKVWDAANGQEQATLKGHTGTVRAVVFSPDGATLASASFDGTTKLWDLAGRREIATLKGHTDAVWAVAFSPDGKLLATGGADGTAKIWALAGQKDAAPAEMLTLSGHRNWITCLAFTADSGRLATAGFDRTVRLWGAGDGIEQHNLDELPSTVWSLAFSQDGKTLALGLEAVHGEESTVKIWTVPASRRVKSF